MLPVYSMSSIPKIDATISYLEEAYKEIDNSRVNFLYHIALLEKCILNISKLSGAERVKVLLPETNSVKKWLRQKIWVNKHRSFLSGKEYKRHKPKPFRSQIGKYRTNFGGSTTKQTQSLINLIHGELRMLDNVLSILVTEGKRIKQRLVPLVDVVGQMTNMRLKVLHVKGIVEKAENYYHVLMRRSSRSLGLDFRSTKSIYLG
jgi:hypothetical protein